MNKNYKKLLKAIKNVHKLPPEIEYLWNILHDSDRQDGAILYDHHMNLQIKICKLLIEKISVEDINMYIDTQEEILHHIISDGIEELYKPILSKLNSKVFDTTIFELATKFNRTEIIEMMKKKLTELE